MVVSAGGGGGQFVGLDPAGASRLVSATGLVGIRCRARARVLERMVQEAGCDGSGVTTQAALRAIDEWLDRSAIDVRWRMALLTDGGAGGGMLLGTVPFASAATAWAAGERHGRRVELALRRYLDADADAEDAAIAQYLAAVRATQTHAADPQWAGGFLQVLGVDGIANVDFFVSWNTDGPGEHRAIAGPVLAALATGLRHGTAPRGLDRQLLAWPEHDLARLLSLAPADTGFLVAAARKILLPDLSGERSPWAVDTATFELTVGALADNPEASYRFATSRSPYGARAAIHLFAPDHLAASTDAGALVARVLEQGLVEYPAAGTRWEWARAVDATEDVITQAGRLRYLMDDVDPRLNAALVTLLRPHLDAVAVIGARSITLDDHGYDLAVPPPDGRRTLDVDPEALREYLGAVMQHDRGVTEMQLLLAVYSQADLVQFNRLPLLDGQVDQLDPFIADSLRIAGLAGVFGQGLDIAGHDEESRTRLLTGALRFATGKGIKGLPLPQHPAAWLARQGGKYLAGKAVDEFSEWVASFEPIEGEDGVDAFLGSYRTATQASLREHIAATPELAALPAAEQDAMMRRALALANAQVGEGLRVVYAELVGETRGE